MSSTTKIRVWDLPTRLFHWLLVVLLGLSWLTQWWGWMDLHYLFGEAILTLLLFRVAWGFVGSDTARFGFFLKSPAAALRHLMHPRRREPDTELGHNAAGGWMVLALLGLLFAQIGTGLFANDEDAFVEGPLRHLVSRAFSDTLSQLHGVIFTLTEVAVILHIAAIAAYRILKGHDLVWPMITGRKAIDAPVTPPAIVGPAKAVVVLGVAILAVAALVGLP